MEERQKTNKLQGHTYVPPPPKKNESDELLEGMNRYDAIAKLKMMGKRNKRSLAKKKTENKHTKRSVEKTTGKRLTRNSNNNNNTVKFYSTVDELNEDTLKNSNISGTLQAKRVELNALPEITRRSNTIHNSNKSLRIDLNGPKMYSHITDNKIDTADHEIKFDKSHENLNIVLGNQTQLIKDKDLSKLVVNELKPGKEIIGDSHAPVTSNITFTSENDTLTAMAFIAGNLLNKLWSMEKDASGSALETEDLKQEKISDLLNLFKEPLNLRQEAFLKNALEQLSSAIDKDKDMKNVTICQTIDEATKLINDESKEEETPSVIVKEQTEPCNKISRKNENSKQQIATVKAISKINNVLSLLKKFENVQSKLMSLKNESILDVAQTDKPTSIIKPQKLIIDSILTKEESNSLNTFGNIINKMTKLLLPKRNNKKIENAIRNQNLLSGNTDNIKDKFMKMYNVDLANITVTAKDKIILDYLTHINNNPDCIKNNGHTDFKSLPRLEGNILLNLSEFFKMKSLTELVNMLHVESEKPQLRDQEETTKLPVDLPVRTTATTITITQTEKSKKFASTKEKLKTHLKSIIEDLIELQNAKGIPSRGNIKIADALPCIYNIMNVGKDIFTKSTANTDANRKMSDIFNELKSEMKIAQITRRSDSVTKIRPKSAIVLERIIKRFGAKSNLNARRFDKTRPTSIEIIKELMGRINHFSDIYKNQALNVEVQPAERVVLLKTLEADVKSYITALGEIKEVFRNLNELPAENHNEVATFIVNAANNISLNELVIDKVEKMDSKKYVSNERVYVNNQLFKTLEPKFTQPKFSGDHDFEDSIKISRNQIINHLIRKRMQTYINMREAQDYNAKNDINYNIAKRVLFYLESGNDNLAHELFKMLVIQKQDSSDSYASKYSPNYLAAPAIKNIENPNRHIAVPQLQPLMQFEVPKTLESQTAWMNQDHLIKQLLNIKNLGV